MKIEVNLFKNMIKHDFEMENTFGITNIYEGFKIDYSKGRRVYLVAMNGGIPYTSFYKNMSFENGKTFIKFNKKKVKIGTYKEV